MKPAAQLATIKASLNGDRQAIKEVESLVRSLTDEVLSAEPIAESPKVRAAVHSYMRRNLRQVQTGYVNAQEDRRDPKYPFTTYATGWILVAIDRLAEKVEADRRNDDPPRW